MCMLNTNLMLLQVRDITSEPAWWEAYSLTIPVLTVADMDGSNEVWMLQRFLNPDAVEFLRIVNRRALGLTP